MPSLSIGGIPGQFSLISIIQLKLNTYCALHNIWILIHNINKENGIFAKKNKYNFRLNF